MMERSGPDNISGRYFGVLNDDVRSNPISQEILNRNLSCLVYGFKYIYDEHKKYVLPVEFTDKEDNISLGSCFLYRGGIATARHCIEGAKSIAIQGIPKEQMLSAKYRIHENELMDLVFIQFEIPITDTIIFGDKASILDEVMAMGYPRIAGYHNFLTAEKATVSARFTASVGQIAAHAKDIWIRERLFLITAKIRGGNSGGLIIRKDGTAVGVSVSLAEGEGDYDDLGYGTVIPITFLDEIIQDEEKRYLNVDAIKFKDFE
jgi:S1-C subfamily serine protease